VLAIPGVLYVLYYTHLFDNAAWFYNFRALRFTELLASGMGFLAGFLYSAIEPEAFGEELAIPEGLFVLLFIPFMKPVSTPLDSSQLKDRCDGEACLQSTPSTCGPTSAANVLWALGRPSSEKEPARAAYTYVAERRTGIYHARYERADSIRRLLLCLHCQKSCPHHPSQE
jgi:hypothetical protein